MKIVHEKKLVSQTNLDYKVVLVAVIILTIEAIIILLII
jgi:hypothetical protein